MINPLTKIQRILYQIGGYRCPHFKIRKLASTKVKKTCCGDKGEEYVPVCGLTNGPCVGLAQCPRLDVKTKSDLIQQWTKDLRTNAVVNPIDYVKE